MSSAVAHADTCAHRGDAHGKNPTVANLPLDICNRDMDASGGSLQTSESAGLTEIWKPVPGYEGWTDVSNLGRVRRWYRRPGRRSQIEMLQEPRIATPECKPGVRPMLGLRNAFGCAQMSLNRAVLLAHLGVWLDEHGRPYTMSCHFPDANVSNNRLDNLRWGDVFANSEDEIAHRSRSLELVALRLDFLRQEHPHLTTSLDGIWFSRRKPLKPRARVSKAFRRKVLWGIDCNQFLREVVA